MTLDFEALDADISGALLGTVSLLLVFDRWATPLPTQDEKLELARYVSERVHDALADRVRAPG